MVDRDGNEITVAENFSAFLAGLAPDALPSDVTYIATRDLIDAAGLCLAARRSVYMCQILESADGDGPCTAIGQTKALSAQDAALANGVAIHGEDFDDTLEGAPIRVGAMVIPAVLAAAERHGLSGARTQLGIAAGLEAICRLNHVAAGHMHRAGFHPVGVIGALGAAAGAGVALGLDCEKLTAAFGIAASFSSGIIEYLTDGAWTKRLHPGWAAQSGLKAALIAKTGFFAPRTVFDGAHNFFRTFAPTAIPDYSHLTDGLGEDWYMTRIVFKPYACGTMIHPYIDCARKLGRDGIKAEDIESILCDTGEGLVHRLWEPLEAKHEPAVRLRRQVLDALLHGARFLRGRRRPRPVRTTPRCMSRTFWRWQQKISYRIDPDNEYPRNY